MVGDFESKAISASNSVEVEVAAELGKNPFITYFIT